MTKSPARTAVDLLTAGPRTRATGDGYEVLGVVVKYRGRGDVHLDLHAALRLARQLTDAVNSIIATTSPKGRLQQGKPKRLATERPMGHSPLKTVPTQLRAPPKG